MLQRKEHVSGLEIAMDDTVRMEKCQRLQELLQNALCHIRRITDIHFPPTRLELRQLLNHGIHTGAHRLEDQALVGSIRAAVFELSKQFRNMVLPLYWCSTSKVSQDPHLACLS